MNTDTISNKEIKEVIQSKEVTNQQLLTKLMEIERRLDELAAKLMTPVINGR